ncbi:LysE family translocator [Pseudomonas sp. NA-150]|uniref:LysE family translocator n=1 Tax=Pseudomonas sp. NA-150 TaxID=3367525 RepID=UPI0037CC8453
MSIGVLAAFWAVSFLFVITPGVDWAYSISAGLHGRRVMPAVAGMLSGHLAATLVVATGVGSAVASMPVTMSLLTVGGGLYLLWLGVNLLVAPASAIKGAETPAGSSLRWYVKGFCVSGLNPKVFLLFLALLPQFSDPHSTWPMPMQLICLGMVHMISCAVVYLVVGFGAKTVLRTRPGAAKVVSQISGGAMVIVAVSLVVERFI